MIGYLLFGITLLFYFGLILINTSQPSMAGEGGMGYGLALFALGIGFAISSLLLTINVAGKDGLLWVSNQDNRRILIIGLGWLFMAATTFACAVFKWEWHEDAFPDFLRWLAVSNGQVWIPLLMFVPYFILINEGIKSGIPANSFKLPLMVGFCISTVCGAGLLFGWLKITVQNQTSKIERQESEDDRIHKEHLSYIAEQKPTDPILNILSLTGRFHEVDVRNAAIAKVKSHPDWEAELIRLLDNEYYFTHVYTFIDGNKVEHPTLFLEPLNRSIFRLGDQITKQIKGSYDLQGWYFESYGIERLFRAIDEQFSDKGMDFRPAVLKLREALKTFPPEKNRSIQFTVTPEVEGWLKNHP